MLMGVVGVEIKVGFCDFAFVLIPCIVVQAGRSFLLEDKRDMEALLEKF